MMATYPIAVIVAICVILNSVPSSLSSSTKSPESDLQGLRREDLAQKVKDLRNELADLEHQLEEPAGRKEEEPAAIRWMDRPAEPNVRYENMPQQFVMHDPDTISDQIQRQPMENYVNYHPRQTGWQPVRRMVGFQPMKRGVKSMVGWQPVKRGGSYQQRMVGFQPMKRTGDSEQDYVQYPGNDQYPRMVGWQPVRRSLEQPRDERMVGWQPVRSVPDNGFDYDGEPGNQNNIEREVLNTIEGHMKADLNAIQQHYGIRPESILKDLRSKHSDGRRT